MNTEMFSEETRTALARMHIEELSEVQTTIPEVLEGKDLCIQSPTGSGKTLAYLLPIVERLVPQGKGKHLPQALILMPTRELALQTGDTARSLLSTREGFRTAVLTGGTDMQAQIRSFARGADIVIATPARLKDHIRRHTFKPQNCHVLVLDEADVMLSMGFREDVEQIIVVLPDHQTLLYSATMNEEVKDLSCRLQKEPQFLQFGTSSLLKQETPITVIQVEEHHKLDALFRLLKTEKQTLVFVNTRKTCAFVTAELTKNHIPCLALYSGLDPKIRKHHMEDFRTGKCQLLIATDVASRGIDIPSIARIISYDYPDQKENLIHRIGRTSRANTHGEAFLFITPQQKDKIAEAEALMQEKVQLKKYKDRRKEGTAHRPSSHKGHRR